MHRDEADEAPDHGGSSRQLEMLRQLRDHAHIGHGRWTPTSPPTHCRHERIHRVTDALAECARCLARFAIRPLDGSS